MNPGTTIYFFGGDPFTEKKHIYWNFVALDYALIDKASQKWQNKQFPPVFDGEDLVPLPQSNGVVKK